MHFSSSSKLLVGGDSHGNLFAWRILPVDKSSQHSDTLPIWSTSLNEVWKNVNPEQSKENENPNTWSWVNPFAPRVTVTVFLVETQRLVCGLENGKIVIMPAIELLEDCVQFNENSSGMQHLQTLEGHSPSKVTALLYPHADDSRYDPDHLISGGADFSVSVWSLRNGSRLHRFTVQAGEILRLMVTPSNCSVVSSFSLTFR